MNQKSKGILYALLATAIWSANFIFARDLYDLIDPISFSFYRWLTACIVILPLVIMDRSNLWRLAKKHASYLIVTSLLGVTIFNSVIYHAARTTPAINLSLIAMTTPMILVLHSYLFLGEKLNYKKWFALFIVFCGIILLISKGDINVIRTLQFSKGDFWMLSACLCFSTYTILSRKRPEDIDSKSFIFLTFMIGTAVLSPVFLYARSVNSPIEWTGSIIGAILYVGIGASLVSYYLWEKSTSIIGAAHAGAIYNLLPICSTILAIIFLGEQFTIFQGISMISVLGGLWLYHR
jgi:drug/metabolite transporter (DMT)-like permease